MEEYEEFRKEIKYNDEEWLKDEIFGQKGFDFHGHLTMSGAVCLWYLRTASGKEIIKDGKCVNDN